jgi:hypothetical protein
MKSHWLTWLRHCDTSRAVAGLIPKGVIWIFYLLNLSGHAMVLGFDSASNKNEKGKVIPVQAWTDPEGSRRLRFPDNRHLKVVRFQP